MWNDVGIWSGMGIAAPWHWFAGFHGALSLIFLGLIGLGIYLLVRDLAAGRREKSR